MQQVLACLDMGTNRIKVSVYTAHGACVSHAEHPSPPLQEWHGFVAFDVNACLVAVHDVLAKARDRLDAVYAIRGIIITSQRATLILVDRSGAALAPALSWQDTSGETTIADFAARVGPTRFVALTGLPASPLWSLAKILRLRRDVPDVFAKADKCVLLHDYMLKQLGAERFVTDASNASVTGLFDIRENTWSRELLAAAELPVSFVSELMPAGSVCGRLGAAAAAATGIDATACLLTGGGDQQCAALGLGAVAPGDAALSLGTSAVLLCPVEQAAPEQTPGFFCTAHVLQLRRLLEGIHNAFAASLAWIGDVQGLAARGRHDDSWEASPPGACGVQFLPFLNGIGSPDYDGSCAGTFLGLRPIHTATDMRRAVFEGVMLETRRMLETLAATCPIQTLIVGGNLASGPTGQLLADVIGRDLHVSAHSEVSLLGAAMVGWRGLDPEFNPDATLDTIVRRSRQIVRARAADIYDPLFERYRSQVAWVRDGYGHQVGNAV